jgi:hypothetical protein
MYVTVAAEGTSESLESGYLFYAVVFFMPTNMDPTASCQCCQLVVTTTAERTSGSRRASASPASSSRLSTHQILSASRVQPRPSPPCITRRAPHTVEEREEDECEGEHDDENDALDRAVSWQFWLTVARAKQSVPPPKFTGVVERTSDRSPTAPQPQPMLTEIKPKLSTPDNINSEPDSKSIRVREKYSQQLQFLKFSGDRDTNPSTVDWSLQLVAQYVRLGGGVGVSEEDRLVGMVGDCLFVSSYCIRPLCGYGIYTSDYRPLAVASW